MSGRTAAVLLLCCLAAAPSAAKERYNVWAKERIRYQRERVQKDPYNPELRVLLAIAYFEDRSYSEAAGHLEEFLSLFAESPFAWPLMRERAICEPVVASFLDRNPDSRYRESARSLLAAIRGVDDARDLVLSERERAVLVRLGDQRDKQIAAALGLTADGARYHMRKLFTRLGVRTRADAVRRAGELGLIPDDS